MKLFIHLWFLGAFVHVGCQTPAPTNQQAESIRFASYNVALYRSEAGGLEKDLASKQDTQLQNVAAVIQHVRPDVLALMEFDYNSDEKLLHLFQENYLSISQQGDEAIGYPYVISIASNTGVLSDHDLNNDGKIALPDDGYGYGAYEGQYAFALLSKYPIKEEAIRSLQKFRWQNMPGAKKPIYEDGTSFYEDDEWKDLRISSKNHVDIPVAISDQQDVHVILAHPTPPVFDGAEDRNGKRNFDEIRLLSDYINGADYLVDDHGNAGGLEQGAAFVVMGDLNADPKAGDSYQGAISQLLDNPRVHQAVASGALVPKNAGGTQSITRIQEGADPMIATSFFGLRIDYVLPSANAAVINTGVFWPAEGEALYEQVKDRNASDHLLVYVDVRF